MNFSILTNFYIRNKSSFLEVAYLLLNGELPKKPEKEEFENAITFHTMVHLIKIL